MKLKFWINFELEQQNSVGHFFLIDVLETVDCGNRVVERLPLLLAISDITPSLARTLGDSRMS